MLNRLPRPRFCKETELSIDVGQTVAVQIEEPFTGAIERERVLQIVAAVLRAHERADIDGLSIVLTDDEQIRRLNARYRHVERATDVLAFAASEGEAMPKESLNYLGDVVISVPTAGRQALEEGHSLDAELALLIVHGCLHLLGYVHDTREDRELMWRRQREILDDLGYVDVAPFADE